MAYSTNIATILRDQLAKFVTLNPHQICGHAANLDFWASEVRHCLDVLDGYHRRFETLRAAQAGYVVEHGTFEYRLDEPQLRSAPRPTRAPDGEFKEARRLLRDAFYRFVVRCFNEGFVDSTTLRRVCEHLDIGIEPSDLKSRT